MFKVRSSHEEIPHVQGKRNPRKTVGVARGHHRVPRQVDKKSGGPQGERGLGFSR